MGIWAGVCASEILFCSGRNEGWDECSTGEGHPESQSGGLCCSNRCCSLLDQSWTWQDRFTPSKLVGRCWQLLPIGIHIALASMTKRVWIDTMEGSLLWELVCLFNDSMAVCFIPRFKIHSCLRLLCIEHLGWISCVRSQTSFCWEVGHIFDGRHGERMTSIFSYRRTSRISKRRRWKSFHTILESIGIYCVIQN